MTFAMGGVPHAGPRQVSILHSSFFMVQLSHWYMTSGKTTALIIWAFVGKVMSLLLNILSRFVKVFLPSSKCLLISWLQLLSTVILEIKKINSVTASIFGVKERTSLYHLGQVEANETFVGLLILDY